MDLDYADTKYNWRGVAQQKGTVAKWRQYRAGFGRFLKNVFWRPVKNLALGLRNVAVRTARGTVNLVRSFRNRGFAAITQRYAKHLKFT